MFVKTVPEEATVAQNCTFATLSKRKLNNRNAEDCGTFRNVAISSFDIHRPMNHKYQSLFVSHEFPAIRNTRFAASVVHLHLLVRWKALKHVYAPIYKYSTRCNLECNVFPTSAEEIRCGKRSTSLATKWLRILSIPANGKIRSHLVAKRQIATTCWYVAWAGRRGWRLCKVSFVRWNRKVGTIRSFGIKKPTDRAWS